MLAIAGGIIIAVLVLAYLDVIIVFGFFALLAIVALVILFLVYESAPAIATILGLIMLGVVSYFVDGKNGEVGDIPKALPNQKKYWVVQISGVDVGIEKGVNTDAGSQNIVQSKSDTNNIWRDLGVHHETLDDAMTFGRRRHDYYKEHGYNVLVRVACSDGNLYKVGWSAPARYQQ